MTKPTQSVKDDESPRCHSDNDGDCTWAECPQRKNYQSGCPLYDWENDERRF